MSSPVSSRRRALVYERDGRRCQYCGKQHLSDSEITADHITPIIHGGGNSQENLRTACKSCNSSRKHSSIEDFRLLQTLKSAGLAQVISTTQAKALMERGIDLRLPEPHVFFFEEAEE